MLSFLTDEHISHVVAEQVRLKRPEIRIESVLQWRGGSLCSTDDRLVLAAAKEEALTLITYDQKTIPPILVELAMNGVEHGGVIFVDRNAIPSHDFGRLVRAIIQYWEKEKEAGWTDRIVFLPAPVEGYG